MRFEPPDPLKQSTIRQKWALAWFLILTVALLYYAKWGPYGHQISLVSHSHTLGPSIITGYSNHAPRVSWLAAWGYARIYFQDIWAALVAGLVIGAGVESLLPPGWLAQKLGKVGWKSRLWAGVAALPSMMCTCCSSPVVVNLKRSNLSTGAIFSYWIANPILNPATIAFMGFVLGWNWALLRIILGVILVGAAGVLGDRWLPQGVEPMAMTRVSWHRSQEPTVLRPFLRSLARLLVRLLPEYGLLVMLLGAARAWLLPAMNPGLAHAWWFLPVVALAGTLLVVPTAGEIPIVLVLMHYGLGRGAAATLLMTLPAISLPSAAMVSQAIPLRVLLRLGLVIALFGIFAGFTGHLVMG
ncbi:MAG: permease [Firmicutes bacterium]|uniref:Permease n=1 Tax=Sulfobacillus benefaciens TaxID=453960 RepID=A0A2T2X5E2_9FIRM|nr:permease [Bacillota bacterium]MCL5012922.1 permease [Bacillota bacterium]PSR29668.1 MAG: permease [Sulfobacillus benefaciens]